MLENRIFGELKLYLLNLFSDLLHLCFLYFQTFLVHLDLIGQICSFTLQTRNLLKSTSNIILCTCTNNKKTTV